MFSIYKDLWMINTIEWKKHKHFTSNVKSQPYIHHPETAPHEGIQPNVSCLLQYLKQDSKYGHIHDALCAMKTHADKTLTVGAHVLQHSWSSQLLPSWMSAFHCHNTPEQLNTFQATLWMLEEHTIQSTGDANATTCTNNISKVPECDLHHFY